MSGYQVLTTAQRLSKGAGEASGGEVGQGPSFFPCPPFSVPSFLLPGLLLPLVHPSSSGPTLPLFRIQDAHCLAGTLRLKTTRIPVFPSRSQFCMNRQRGLLPLACGGSALPSPKWTWSLPDAADTGSVPPGSVRHRAGHQPCASSVGTGTKSPSPCPSSSPSPAWLPAPLSLRGEDPSLEG